MAEAAPTVLYKNIEQTWMTFKNILLSSKRSKRVCGTSIVNKNKNQRRWQKRTNRRTCQDRKRKLIGITK